MSKIGELLLNNGLITQEKLNLGVETKRINPKERLGSILRHYNFINDFQIAQMLSLQIRWKLYMGPYEPDREIIDKIGIDELIKHQIFPLKNGHKPAFVVPYVDNVDMTDSLKSILGPQEVFFYIGLEKDVRDALDLIVLEENRKNLSAKVCSVESIEAIPQWLDSMIRLAVMTRCTDIHFHPSSKAAEIRFRIDGLLTPVCCLKQEYIKPIANIILTKCKANPGDYQIQDGSFEFEHTDKARKIDIRFSQIPSVHGPSIVLRLLDKARTSIPLRSLGYSEHNWKVINQAIKAPHGIILVTGPTGCGKSTTLYAMLNHIKSLERKILTVEDPVEMDHSLMTQLQVNATQELTFSRAIRAFLRQDPDIILVGEIRDNETATEAMRASITGHQIFSTLHTNDPVTALLRLKDLGIEPINIAACLNVVVSQRLVRKLCPHCKKESTSYRSSLDPIESKYLINDLQRLYRAEGCDKCNHGYWGRTVVAEVLVLDQKIKDLIGKDLIGEINGLLLTDPGHQTMLDDMQRLLDEGVTSLEEAVRVLG
jgi:type IV pilus assembly protein PilB